MGKALRAWLREWLGVEQIECSQENLASLRNEKIALANQLIDMQDRLKVTEAYSAELANRILVLERAQADAKQAPRAQTMTGIRRSIGAMGGLKDEVLTR